MTILIINQHYQDVVGGSEVQCHLLATALAQAGHTVIYFAVGGQRAVYQDVAYTVTPGALTWATLAAIIGRYRPDLAYWRFNKRRLLASVLLLKANGVKIVFSVSHGNDLVKWSHKVAFDARQPFASGWAAARAGLSSRINHLGFYGVDGVVAQLQDQCGKLPVRRERLISNAVEATVTPFAWPRPYLAWVANIKPVKQPEMLLELARRLQDAAVDFLMVGKIRTARYAALLDAANLPPNVHYLGEKSLSEVNGILRGALFLVHTCQPEGFPNVLIQAWMQGKPTVSLAYDPDRLIQTQRFGFFSGIFEQFVQDTKTLLDNATMRAEMGQRACAFAATHCSIDGVGRQFEAFFREICGV